MGYWMEQAREIAQRQEPLLLDDVRLTVAPLARSCPTCGRPYAAQRAGDTRRMCPICRERALAETAGFDEACRVYHLLEVHAGLVAIARWTSDPRARSEAQRLAALLQREGDDG